MNFEKFKMDKVFSKTFDNSNDREKHTIPNDDDNDDKLLRKSSCPVTLNTVWSNGETLPSVEDNQNPCIYETPIKKLNKIESSSLEKVNSSAIVKETDTESYETSYSLKKLFSKQTGVTDTNNDREQKVQHASFDTDLDDDYYNDNEKQFLDFTKTSLSQLRTDSTSIEKVKKGFNENRVILNVGGVRHEVMWKTLDRLPRTRLGKLRNAKTIEEILYLCDDYDVNENEYFFDRHPRSFGNIINFYRTGKLHLIEDVCVISFQDDLKYWGIQEFYLALCCQHTYNQKKEVVLEEIRKEEEVLKERRADTFTTCCPSSRKKVWDLMENPQTSKVARVRSSLASNICSTVRPRFCESEGNLDFVHKIENSQNQNSLTCDIPNLGNRILFMKSRSGCI